MEETINDTIKKVAIKYIGQEETVGNSGFKDPSFLLKMKDVGWSKSLSWCSFFAELVWEESFKIQNNNKYNLLTKIFSASATTTYKNFELNKTFKVSKIPVVGALAVWREGVGWQGHIGVVIELHDNNIFYTVEGNTNDNGSREGVKVAKKLRKIDFSIRQNSLNLIGFVYPNETIK